MTKLLALAPLALAAMTAQATDINLQAVGTWMNQASSPQFFTNETVTYQYTDPGGYPLLTTMYLEVPTITGVGEGADGYFTNGTDGFNFNGIVTDIQTVGNSQSASGTWTYASGAGGFGGFVSGAGTFSVTLDLSGNHQAAFTAFTGDLQPVPEPAAVLPLAIGAIGLIARRRFSA